MGFRRRGLLWYTHHTNDVARDRHFIAKTYGVDTAFGLGECCEVHAVRASLKILCVHIYG